MKRVVSAKYVGGFDTGADLEKALDMLTVPYYAMVARSNAGKSSLINALLGEKLALVSKTPGRTRCAHLFQTKDFAFIDLPGYGFATGGGAENLSRIISECLGIVDLNPKMNKMRVLHLVDAKRANSIGIQDELMIHALSQTECRMLRVITKVDTLSKPGELKQLMDKFSLEENKTWFTSSKTNMGLAQLKHDLKFGVGF